MSRTLRIALLALAMIAVIIGMIAIYARDLRSGAEITLKTEPVDPRSLFLGHYATLGYAINRLDASLIGDHCYGQNAAIFVTLEPDVAGEWRAVRSAPAMPGDGFTETRVTLRGRVQWGSCPSGDAEATAADAPVDDPSLQKTEALPIEPSEPAPETDEAPEAENDGEVAADEISEPLPEAEPVFAQTWVTYGIEQYFASPEAARKLEDLARRRPSSEDGEPPPEPLEIILSVPGSGRALIKGVVVDGEKTYDQTLW